MLSVRGLTLRYPRGPALVTGLDFDAASGELLAVLGPNGAGKSTLLKALVHLLRPRAGSARLDGADLTRLGPRERARRVAWLPQQSRPAPVTVAEAVLLGRLPHGGGGAEDLAILEAVLAALGLAALAGRPCTELSGGELQKVLIARALAQTPRLLALDEPVNHLDLARQIEVLELVRKTTRARGLVTLVVLHDLNLALRFADRFLLLDGRGDARLGPMDSLDAATAGAVYGIPLVVGEVGGHPLLVPL
jgi:iron complex transport system ATP-binding protein